MISAREASIRGRGGSNKKPNGILPQSLFSLHFLTIRPDYSTKPYQFLDEESDAIRTLETDHQWRQARQLCRPMNYKMDLFWRLFGFLVRAPNRYFKLRFAYFGIGFFGNITSLHLSTWLDAHREFLFSNTPTPHPIKNTINIYTKTPITIFIASLLFFIMWPKPPPRRISI